MMEFLTADGNLPFAIALAVMLLIALLEGVAIVLGAGLSGFIDAVLPLDLDADAPNLSTEHSLSRLLGWLRFGQVPALMLLVVFLADFGLIGLGLQSLVSGSVGFLLPASVAAVTTFLVALPVTRWFGGLLARIIPKDETDAVSEQSFIGRVGTITLGTAQFGKPAEARLKDVRGQTHYVMVQPDIQEENFPAGTQVLLISQSGAIFNAIRNTNPALTD